MSVDVTRMASQDRYSAAARTIYDKIVDWYVSSYWNDKTDLDWINRFVNEFTVQSRLCDMASGPGNFSQYLRADFHDVTCVDISEKMIAAAMKRLPRVHGLVADMRALPIEDGYFDGLLCAYSLNHIIREEVDKVIAEFRRIIRPGGILYVMLKEGDGRYEFTASELPEVKGVMELWNTKLLESKLSEHQFEAFNFDRKRDVNPNEFQHSKILVCCRAV